MVKARKDDDERPVADAAADLSRLAESSTKLFAEQAAAFAVMTAYGMSIAAQMTGMMLGSLRGPADAADLQEQAPEAASAEPKPDAPVKTPTAKVVPLRPRAETSAAPVAEVPAKPAPKAARTVKAKAAPSKPVVAKAKVTAAKPAPAGADDLKKISGIGPRLEQVLNERGIVSYGDVAKLGKAALKKLDTELGLEGRAVKDDWVSQAKALSGGKG